VTFAGQRVHGVDREHDGHLWYSPTPGAYWFDQIGQDWWGCTPNGMIAALSEHTVVEHDDGTISVSPSILCSNGAGGVTWHGYLRNGAWDEA
jgi:hypothetical protein